MTLLADVVNASQGVADTSSRSGKVAILAELLRQLDSGEVPIVAGLLSGIPRQGRVGVGYSTIYGLEQPPAEVPTLEVGDLDAAVDGIEAATGPGSAAQRRRLLEELLGRATRDEADFIRRLFTGDLRQGALAGLMVDAIAKAAGVPAELTRRAFMLSGDLSRTAEVALTHGEQGLRDVGFELFRPVLPMLASTADSVADAVSGFERASVEWKLDGIRIQIHRRADEVRIYTRNLNDITHALPGIVEAVLRLPVRQVVLDGEALWMSADGPAAFQDTVARIDSEARPEGIATFLFDLLHVDGEGLLDTPLGERAARLAALAPELKISGTFTSDPDEAQGVLDDALRAGHEGVVVKDASSVYAAGRRGKAWRKVKPVRTYDLVVLGAEAARARSGAARDCGPGAAGARRGDRTRWRSGVDAIPGRSRPALRAGQALPARQEPRRGGHDRRPARVAASARPVGLAPLGDVHAGEAERAAGDGERGRNFPEQEPAEQDRDRRHEVRRRAHPSRSRARERVTPRQEAERHRRQREVHHPPDRRRMCVRELAAERACEGQADERAEGAREPGHHQRRQAREERLLRDDADRIEQRGCYAEQRCPRGSEPVLRCRTADHDGSCEGHLGPTLTSIAAVPASTRRSASFRAML